MEISIHDVMPHTLPQVSNIIQQMQKRHLPPAILLVVPGLSWEPQHIRQLANWAEAGHELAAHGWVHKAARVSGIYHRLHSVLLSRDAAEHLALSDSDIQQLMQRSSAWFEQNALPQPQRYVPPAWALGNMSSERLSQLPYQRIEVTSGDIELPKLRFTPRPLIGFEADTALRAAMLRPWNRAQKALARRTRQSLRVAIHPNDLHLHLRQDLLRTLDQAAGAA